MKTTLKEQRENKMYLNSLLLHGNGKLLDYEDTESCISYRYAQFNTRPVKDCPFATEGCKAVCYATKGNHVFKSVKESRERSYNDSKLADFSERMIYTIATEKQSKRYKDSVMLIRVHESGDFYSIQYLRKWIEILKAYKGDMSVQFKLYTKSSPFFLMLTEEEKELINSMLATSQLSINLSLDDTTTAEQFDNYLKMRKAFPKANTYYATEDPNKVKHDNVCDCANCAKCGTCNHATGETTTVKIHSASNADMKKYRKNKRNGN